MHDMGAFASIPPGQRVVVGGQITYLLEALAGKRPAGLIETATELVVRGSSGPAPSGAG